MITKKKIEILKNEDHIEVKFPIFSTEKETYKMYKINTYIVRKNDTLISFESTNGIFIINASNETAVIKIDKMSQIGNTFIGRVNRMFSEDAKTCKKVYFLSLQLTKPYALTRYTKEF